MPAQQIEQDEMNMAGLMSPVEAEVFQCCPCMTASSRKRPSESSITGTISTELVAALKPR